MTELSYYFMYPYVTGHKLTLPSVDTAFGKLLVP